MDSPVPDPRLLTPEQVATLLQVSLNQLRAMRQLDKGPKFIRIGHRTIRYDAAVVDTWLRQRAEASR